MKKVHTCPECRKKKTDVSRLPIRCSCGFIDHTMNNIRMEEIDNITAIEHNRKISYAGYGIPKPYEPPKPPEKPDDLPLDVLSWLEAQGQ